MIIETSKGDVTVPKGATFTIESSYDRGSYKTRYSFDNATQAVMHYTCLNAHSGYNKRLRMNGKTIERHMS